MASKSFPVSTQQIGTSTTTYYWVIVFMWTEDLEKPFGIFPLSMFEKQKFPFHWITGPLNTTSRATKLFLEDLSDSKFSVFAKVQEG